MAEIKLVDQDQEYLTKPWTTKQNFMAGKKQLNIITPNTIKSLFLYNINTKESIDLMLIPDTLSESYSQKIISESSFGVLHPINFYVGGSEKSISFSFDMHEDINNIEKSIYKLIDKIKSLSVPVIYNGTNYKPPLIYLQLGDQFAGKGHITTSFSYKKPFTNGRYKLISCSVNFVFHEVFENTNIVLSQTGQQIIESSGVSLLWTRFHYTPIEDFYNENFNYDYLKTYLFDTLKMSEVFNLVDGPIAEVDLSKYTNIKGFENGIDKDTFVSLMTSGTPQDQDVIKAYLGAVGLTQYALYDDPFRIELVSCLYNLLEVLRNPYTERVIVNLKVVQENLNNLKRIYNASTSEFSSTLYNSTNGTTSLEHGYYYTVDGIRKLPMEDKIIFERTLGVNIDIFRPTHSSGLIQIVQKIIDAYSVLRGAGA